jgi:hypothetical protein
MEEKELILLRRKLGYKFALMFLKAPAATLGKIAIWGHFGIFRSAFQPQG